MRGRQIGKPIFQILINVPSMFLGFKRNGKNQNNALQNQNCQQTE